LSFDCRIDSLAERALSIREAANAAVRAAVGEPGQEDERAGRAHKSERPDDRRETHAD
jgi:Arc/MetJ family transcription regulator